MSAYYQSEDLDRFPEMAAGAPDLWERFQSWYGATFAEGRSRLAKRR